MCEEKKHLIRVHYPDDGSKNRPGIPNIRM